jgi:hypothetical protein
MICMRMPVIRAFSHDVITATSRKCPAGAATAPTLCQGTCPERQHDQAQGSLLGIANLGLHIVQNCISIQVKALSNGADLLGPEGSLSVDVCHLHALNAECARELATCLAVRPTAASLVKRNRLLSDLPTCLIIAQKGLSHMRKLQSRASMRT